jgi:hypothetical protein
MLHSDTNLSLLKAGYGDPRAKERLDAAGYKRDGFLSNRNEEVWWNPIEKKLLVNVAGTHNLRDVGTDVALAFGGLKKTSRYKEAGKVLSAAKSKYQPADVMVTGHSLGGAIVGYVANKNDKVVTLDKAATIGQPIRSNETAYRTPGDLVSLLNVGATRMHTLVNANTVLNSFRPLASHGVGKAEGFRIRI